MDYKELTKQVKALENEQKKIERSIEAKIRRRDKKILDLKLQYIAEHQPLPLKRFQRIKVTARVTEESRKWLDKDALQMKKYALGPPILLWECSTVIALTMQGMSYLASMVRETTVVGVTRCCPWS